MYEETGNTRDIAKNENVSMRTIYKYLNLAYLSPCIVNDLMGGTKIIDVQKLFEIASKYEEFEEQEKEIY